MPRLVPYGDFCARHEHTLHVILRHVLSFLEDEFHIDTDIEPRRMDRIWDLVARYVYNTSTSRDAKASVYF